MANKGVRIYLAPRTRVPLWLRAQDRLIQYTTLKLGGKSGRKVYILTIKGAVVQTVPGHILIQMPSSRAFRVGFRITSVLQVQRMDGELQWRNYYCCKKCLRMTGEVKTSQQGSREGYRNLTVACPPCERTWTLENV